MLDKILVFSIIVLIIHIVFAMTIFIYSIIKRFSYDKYVKVRGYRHRDTEVRFFSKTTIKWFAVSLIPVLNFKNYKYLLNIPNEVVFMHQLEKGEVVKL